MTLHEQVERGRQRLLQAGIPGDEARLDAELLARHALGWDRAAFLSRRREPAPPGFRDIYDRAIARRERREPAAFITGSREFWGLDFEVTPAVLIPRPETELVVEEALATHQDRSWPAEIVDVGTGSGCLAVALAIELPASRVTAIDLSRAALDLARRNAARHGVAGRVRCVQASLLSALRGPIDLVVSNPPYVPRGSIPTLQAEVGAHEPWLALDGGAEGIDLLHRLAGEAAGALRPGGILIMEFGQGQERAVRTTLAIDAGWTLLRIRHDLQGIARVVVARRE